MSFGDDVTEPDERQPPTKTLTAAELVLLAKPSWSHDELITIAFIARRLAAQLGSHEPE